MNPSRKPQIRTYLLMMAVVAFFGQIYFYPFQSTFRFSAGVLALILILLIREDISEVKLAVMTSTAIVLLRTAIRLYLTDLPLLTLIEENLPAGLYYLSFGLMVWALRLRARKDQPFVTMAAFAVVDVASNLVEAWVGNTFNSRLLVLIVTIGIARSVLAYFVYFLYRSQELLIMKREHQKRYAQLNAVMANIQAEIFYLKKSMGEIESVMSRSHRLYEAHKDNPGVRDEALTIARDVHEIKKDYYRVLRGFEGLVKTFEKDGAMSLKDIASIIEVNARRILEELGSAVTFRVEVGQSIQIKAYHSVFTMLNNLIVNAMDACGDKGGDIMVILDADETQARFVVRDTGEGIEDDVLPVLFTPGFTTKYDEATGAASTGIGLAHVKNLLDALGGSIEVNTEVGRGTAFILTIPRQALEA
ncbi:sensor histidine kinase [Acidaminobacter hydrogenoformans]|uniref:histidine kinase n=1 Tax=Acidaminobacter hydrogenoformans DSM 2784 TaxID=1120920 RepID=A0A1G5RUP9_9FIRM|nr:sensor histidine kinase [Acidaminobacter hydrogenoformans]SCZ77885.1 two-component system, sensor histidine kinase YcbA [Acidaminobacter hydrogenoformans DSM 2784]